MRKSKNIKSIKKQAQDAWKKKKRKEAYDLWEKARIARLDLQDK